MTQADAPVPPPPKPLTLRDRAALVLVPAILRLPFWLRVRLSGFLGRRLIGPASGQRRKVAAAVRHFLPDLPATEVSRIAAAVPGNLARMVIEVLSGPDLRRLAPRVPIDGPGLAALTQAHEAGRPALLVTGHFGNYEAMRVALIARGFPVGGYFKDFKTPEMTRIYLDSAGAAGQPLFADTGEGRKRMIRFLRGGGMLGILIDLDRPNGVLLDFLGQPTRTVLSMAEMALKYNALLVPVWGLRTTRSPGFRVLIDAPVPHSEPRAMTQALNDAFAAQVRAHPEQWVWWHNRRKRSHPPPTAVRGTDRAS